VTRTFESNLIGWILTCSAIAALQLAFTPSWAMAQNVGSRPAGGARPGAGARPPSAGQLPSTGRPSGGGRPGGGSPPSTRPPASQLPARPPASQLPSHKPPHHHHPGYRPPSYHHHHYYYRHGHRYYPSFVAGMVVGAYVASLPATCVGHYIGGVAYYSCGDTWLQYAPGSTTTYVVVNPPH
jgi:hypothetical protein